MARFDIFTNMEGSGYLLDIQADILSGLNLCPRILRVNSVERNDSLVKRAVWSTSQAGRSCCSIYAFSVSKLASPALTTQ